MRRQYFKLIKQEFVFLISERLENHSFGQLFIDPLANGR